MSWLKRSVSYSSVLLFAILATACAHPNQADKVIAAPSNSAIQSKSDAAPVILISIDGFKPDYLTRGVTPNLNALAKQGAVADAMRPAFPSITFPNHYTLVTGLTPDHHGVVGNTMEDAAIPNQRFSLGNREAVIDRRWWDQAEPVWVTAQKNGVPSATMFWPGSEADIHGVRPSEWRVFNGKISAEQRVATVLEWMDKPLATRPRFITLYFDEVDHSGHMNGPDSELTTQAAAHVDQVIGMLLSGLNQRQINANIVIVSDHGMAAIDSSRTIVLDQLAPRSSYRLITAGAYAGIEPQAGQEHIVNDALLKPHQHMQCWAKATIPARLHFGQNARVPSIVCMPEVGWVILADQANVKNTAGGAHGYDNQSAAMQAIFIAAGPAFKEHVQLPAFDNVDVYPLLMRLINVPALPSDGNLDSIRPALK